MEAFSIIEIPEYMRKKFKKELLGSWVDYRRFNIKSEKVLDDIFWIRRNWASDTDNSNIVYDQEIVYQRIRSPRGNAHIASITIEWVWVVPIFMLEVYGKWQWLQGAIARVDFYGWYYRFRNIIDQRILDIEEMLVKKSRSSESNHLVRQTRIDIAFDFLTEYPQNAHNWICPSKNSSREVTIFRDKSWKYTNVWYLSEKNSWYWVRIYNKIVETEKHKKTGWYGWIDSMPKNWTRIEFEFYNPYSTKYEDFELFKFVSEKIIWDNNWIDLWMTYRPPIGFKVETAYEYIRRYAKNHGVDILYLLDSVYDYHMWVEEKKNYYWLVNE